MTDNKEKYIFSRVALSDLDESPWILEVFCEAESTNFELGLDWFRHLAATAIPEEEEVWVYASRSSAGSYAVLPARIDRKTSTLHALSNYYSSIITPLVGAGQGIEPLVSLFQGIFLDERVATINLAPLDSQGTTSGMIEAALVEAGWRSVYSYFAFANWSSSVLGRSFSEYISSRSGRLRNTVGRKSRKFRAIDGASIEVTLESDQLGEMIASYEDIYQQRWNKAEPWKEFLPGLINICMNRGWLRLGFAYIDGEAIATQLWIVANGRASMYKMAQKPGYDHLSIGTVLTSAMLEHVLDIDQASDVDFMRGDEAYKKDWMETRSERSGIVAHNPRRPTGSWRIFRELAASILKRIMTHLSFYK